ERSYQDREGSGLLLPAAGGRLQADFRGVCLATAAGRSGGRYEPGLARHGRLRNGSMSDPMSGIGAKMAGGNSATGRKQDDFYATTDTNVTEALLQEFSFDGTIHECACGTGEMAEVIKKYGYEVVATDLV